MAGADQRAGDTAKRDVDGRAWGLLLHRDGQQLLGHLAGLEYRDDPAAGCAAEKFDHHKMNGFLNPVPILVRTADGRNFERMEPIDYRAKDGRIYRAPAGGTTDGLSVPQPAWFRIAPFGVNAGNQWRGWKSANIHDSGYQKTLQVQTHGGNWIAANLDRAQCDDLIAEAMESENVPGDLQFIVFEVLREFGQKAFDEDRAVKVG